jgi:hypothetical protein
MGLKHLKEQNPDLNINLIDLISKLDPTKTKKLTPLLIKMLKDGIEIRKNDMYWGGNENDSPTVKIIKELPDPKMTLLNWLCVNYFNVENLDKMPLFVEYLDRGLIENTDVSTYSNFQEIITEIGKAATKEMLKKSKKDIMIVHDDEEWLFFKPLTHDAAITYGFGTKWCTSMKNDGEYFYRYSAQGVLIYIINKKTNRKFGIHSNNEVKIGIYDEVDNHIDSFETGLPNELIKKLFEWLDVKTNHTNYDLFSPEEKIKSRKYYFNGKDEIIELTEQTMEELSIPVEDMMMEDPILTPRMAPRLVPMTIPMRNYPAILRGFDDLP